MARVLVVDDEKDLRAAIRRQLEGANHTVVEAADGNAAVQVFRMLPVDLVITDILMPGKEGIETIIELRQERPDVPIIAMSGGGRTHTRQYLELAQRLGVKGILKKPFRRSELLAAVAAALTQ